jgi:hypothetical protein
VTGQVQRLSRMGLPITSVEQGIVTIDFNLAHLAEHLASSHELRRELRSGAIDYTSTNPSHVYSLSEDRGRRTVQLGSSAVSVWNLCVLGSNGGRVHAPIALRYACSRSNPA